MDTTVFTPAGEIHREENASRYGKGLLEIAMKLLLRFLSSLSKAAQYPSIDLLSNQDYTQSN